MDDPLVEPVSGRGRRPARPGRDPAGGGAARGGATGGSGELGPRDAGRHLAPRRRDPVRGPHEGAEGDPLPAPTAEGTEARGGRGRLVHVGARPGPRVRRATGGGGPRGPGRDRNRRIGGTG